MKRKLFVSIFISFFLAISILVSFLRIFDTYELLTLDMRFRLRPKLPINDKIVIIEISDDTIDKLGSWPIPRQFHGVLVDALTEAGVRTIVFDIFFSEKSNEEDDRIFEESIRKSGRVYLPYIFNITGYHNGVPTADKMLEAPLKNFSKAVKGAGFINIVPDVDAKFRRIPAFINLGSALYPHLVLSVYADFIGMELEKVIFAPARFVKFGGLTIPLDMHSNVIVNFPGRWKDTFRHISYIDVLDSYISWKFPEKAGRKPIIDLETLHGTVCFIGVTATGTPDVHPSPFDSLYPGVGVHASLFNSLIIGNFIRRASREVNIAILLILIFLVFLVSKRAKTIVGFLLVSLFMVGYIVMACLSFLLIGLWVDIFYPSLVMMLLYLGMLFSRYVGEMHKREVLEKELSIAKKIQESFLPKETPDIDGLEMNAKMFTARQVGGDLYDFIKIDKNRCGVMIGDVSGKGVPAALYMAKVVSEFKTFAKENSPSQTLSFLNQRLCNEGGGGLFVTIAYAVFDLENMEVTLSSGGHLPMLVVKSNIGKVFSVNPKEGMPLGILEGVFTEEKLPLGKDDIFLLYTDGVTEAKNLRGEMFGENRLTGFVKDSSGLSSEEVVNMILRKVTDFERRKQHDDMTVIAVKVR